MRWGKSRPKRSSRKPRWTITTVYDSGSKVAKDQLTAAQARSKTAVERLQAQQQEALQLLQQWQFANDLPLITAPGAAADSGDPWQALQECASEGTAFLERLQGLKLPGYVRGLRPFLVIGAVWLLASLPALLLREWDVVYWLAATTATIIPAGVLIRLWLKIRARTQAVYLWSGLSQAGVDAKQLRPRCLDLAKKLYRDQKSDNKRRNQEALNQVASATRKSVQKLRQERGEKLAPCPGDV